MGGRCCGPPLASFYLRRAHGLIGFSRIWCRDTANGGVETPSDSLLSLGYSVQRHHTIGVSTLEALCV